MNHTKPGEPRSTGPFLACCIAMAGFAGIVVGSTGAWAAGKPGGGGPGPGGGGKTPPNPDIVYMSGDNLGLNNQSAIRGIAFSADGSTTTDTSLFKTAANRLQGAVAWSPDGQQFAWFEATDTTQSIVVAAPGGQPKAVYTVTHPIGYPVIEDATDGLAWGPACSGSGSTLLFRDSSGIRKLNAAGGSYTLDPQALGFFGIGLALSPSGRNLAYWRSDGIWILPICDDQPQPVLLVPDAAIDDYLDPDIRLWVESIDWSPDGRRLAMSLTYDYLKVQVDPWRDIKIVGLDYCAPAACGSEEVGFSGDVSLLPASAEFPFESSEVHPNWGPPLPGSTCPRLAFSRSNAQGRYMYVVDSQNSACGLESAGQVAAKAPRALDWK